MSVEPKKIVMAILDSSHVFTNKTGKHSQHMDERTHFDRICSSFIYKLHHVRAITLGGDSQYKLPNISYKKTHLSARKAILKC